MWAAIFFALFAVSAGTFVSVYRRQRLMIEALRLARQKIQITYYQELDSDEDWTTYIYPLASNARQVVNSRVSGPFSLTIDVKSAEPIAESSSS